MRGIEITLNGKVNKQQDGTNVVLTLAGTPSRPEVVLAPFQATSNIEWDMQTQSPRPVSDQERGAYALLSSAVASGAAGTTQQVTGRLHKGANGFSIDVRSFKKLQ